ncbi:MAG: hypothetical protein K8R46_00720, partial [Pirellulales bacterium]|nr:hypothetical protein [Pirellulales bacterium]
GQFLFSALGSLCREAHLAPNLVGTPGDIRQWMAYRTRKKGTGPICAKHPAGRSGKLDLSPFSPAPPKLARGWRAEFVGRLFDDLLAGKTSVRVGTADLDHPLAFHPPRSLALSENPPVILKNCGAMRQAWLANTGFWKGSISWTLAPSVRYPSGKSMGNDRLTA